MCYQALPRWKWEGPSAAALSATFFAGLFHEGEKDSMWGEPCVWGRAACELRGEERASPTLVLKAPKHGDGDPMESREDRASGSEGQTLD